MLNSHAVHRTFATAAERDAVMRGALAITVARGFEAPEMDPLFAEHVWNELCAQRAGSPLPVPTYAFFREHWDFGGVLPACTAEELAEFGDFDAESTWNIRPEQQGFASPEERILVLAAALAETPGCSLRNLAYASVWRGLVACRAGTMLALPSYKYVRGRACWDEAIQEGPR